MTAPENAAQSRRTDSEFTLSIYYFSVFKLFQTTTTRRYGRETYAIERKPGVPILMIPGRRAMRIPVPHAQNLAQQLRIWPAAGAISRPLVICRSEFVRVGIVAGHVTLQSMRPKPASCQPPCTASLLKPGAVASLRQLQCVEPSLGGLRVAARIPTRSLAVRTEGFCRDEPYPVRPAQRPASGSASRKHAYGRQRRGLG